MTQEDLDIFKQFIADLKAGVVEMDQPIVLKTSFDDKNKRAEFHALFKTKIPEYISDTIVENDNRNMAG